MKKLLVMMVSLIWLSSAFAGDTATLRMKIAGPINDNRYFLCVTGVGCVSIFNGNKGHAYPIHGDAISSISAINATRRALRTQSLPASCNVKINEKQTVTVSGRLVEGPNRTFSLANLHCSVR